MNQKFIYILLTILFFGFTANASNYIRQGAQCVVSGTQQDIDTNVFDLPFVIQASMNQVFIKETGEVVKSSFSGWIPDRTSSSPLPEEVLNRLKAAKFNAFTKKYVGYIGQFNLVIPELNKLDWLELLRHLGGKNIDLSSNYIYSNFSVSESFSNVRASWSTEEFTSPFKPELLTGWRTRKSYEIQIHLPPEIQNGLSFHLKISCFDDNTH